MVLSIYLIFIWRLLLLKVVFIFKVVMRIELINVMYLVWYIVSILILVMMMMIIVIIISILCKVLG